MLALVVGVALGQSNMTCSKATACEPWDLVQGPFCARGNQMNLRFGIDIAPENSYYKYAQDNSEATYAACVTVDQISAVTLIDAARYVGVVVGNGTQANGTETSTTTTTTTGPTATTPSGSGYRFTRHRGQAWLSAYGFGGNDNIAFPTKNMSSGTVMIFSNDTSICSSGKLPFVKFLILKVSMTNGRFAYTTERNQPTGVGFDPTCASGICQLDSDLKCIGMGDNQNCATCLSPDEMLNTSTQVWMSYGGTDTAGKTLLSYTNNPLNYRKYAGSSAYSQLSSTVSDVENGDFGNDPLDP